MTATEALERRIDELCRENERLRQYNNTLRDQVDTAKHNSVRNTREYARLCHVNDKLRELCKDLWRDIPKSNCEWDMDSNLCTGYDKCHGECGLWMRLRELGIEVDA